MCLTFLACRAGLFPVLTARLAHGELALLLSPSADIVKESDGGESKAYSQYADVDAESSAVQGPIISPEYLGAVDTGSVRAHDHPSHQQSLIGRSRPDRQTYMAMAKARSSESRAVKDIQAIFKGCENVPKTWVQTTPKYRTFLFDRAVKLRLRT